MEDGWLLSVTSSRMLRAKRLSRWILLAFSIMLLVFSMHSVVANDVLVESNQTLI